MDLKIEALRARKQNQEMQKIRRQVVAKEKYARINESNGAATSKTGLQLGRIFKKTININKLPNS